MSDAASPRHQLERLIGPAMIGVERAGTAPDALLAEAAVLGMQARAGFRGPSNATPVDPCPPDNTEMAPTSSLERLLLGPDAALIEEWSTLAVACGKRVPDALVAPVLDWWSRQQHRSDAVFQSLGRRGQWLASFNPEWQKPVAGQVVPDDADLIWETGTVPERLAVLTTVRRCEPARAIRMVQQSWSTDRADDRRKFVAVLEESLSQDDEPFLESLLDDRSKVVRRAAADLLGRLPGSRLRERMNGRARSMIRVEFTKGSLIRSARTRVSIELPKEFEASWARDGLEEEPLTTMGRRAWWMQQVLALTDLAVWRELSSLEPRDLLKALSTDDQGGHAINALLAATRLAGDVEWAHALVGHCLAEGWSWLKLDVWSGLPIADREALLMQMVRAGQLDAEERWALMGMAAHGWSAEFSRQAMAMLSSRAPAKRELTWRMSASFEPVSRHIDPGALDAFERALLAHSPDQLPDQVTRCLSRVRLRADIHKELCS